MAMELEHGPLSSEEDLLEIPSRAQRRQRGAGAWKKVLAASAAGLGLLGAGTAVAWNGRGAEVAKPAAAAPLGEFIAEDEEKGEGKKAKEEVKLPKRPTSLNSVPVTSATLKKIGKKGKSSALKIDEDGKINTYYLPGADVINNGSSVMFSPPYRFYLMKSDTTDYSNADNFYKPIFPGKTFSVDMDFHGDNGPACGCNINFYLVDMPVKDAGKDKDHYCDAQCFEGLGCCHEFDMNEGNEHVQQITNHACTADYSQDSTWQCNKWGDPEVKVTPPEFGKGAGKTIDGRKKFTFSQRFDKNGDDLTVITTITQGNKVIKKTMNSNDQMQDMLKKLEQGLAFVTGYWTAPDMNWMDGESCGSGTEHCSEEPAYISNWRITSNGDSPAPSPTPSPSPNPDNKPMVCGWCNSGECNGCTEEPGWCSQSEDNCKKCGQKSIWCPKSKMAGRLSWDAPEEKKAEKAEDKAEEKTKKKAEAKTEEKTKEKKTDKKAEEKTDKKAEEKSKGEEEGPCEDGGC